MSYAYHIDVAVSDYQTSLKFYEGLFNCIDWKLKFEKEDGRSYTDGRFDFWVVQATEQEVQGGKNGLGFTHFAFRVEDPGIVDQVYNWLKDNNYQIDIEPKKYPEYTENYYAVFFFDPDGARLEVVSK